MKKLTFRSIYVKVVTFTLVVNSYVLCMRYHHTMGKNHVKL